MAGSVAALDDDRLLAEHELTQGQRSAQSLAPSLVELARQVGWAMLDVQLIAVTIGPGSFTGLRVGATTAKVLAYAARAEVLGVSTLQAIALRAPAGTPELSVAIDAQRGDVIAQPFRFAPDGWPEPLGPERLLPLVEWLALAEPGSALSGPILRKAPSPPPGVVMVDRAFWNPTAAAVGQIAARLHAAGQRGDLWTLLPRYSRRAAAEEKLDK